jgi:hypothetical protein
MDITDCSLDPRAGGDCVPAIRFLSPYGTIDPMGASSLPLD